MALNDKDIDESMAADWAAIREKHTVEEPEAPAPEPVEPAEPVKEAIPVSREPDGKFKAQEKEKLSKVKEAPVKLGAKEPTEVPEAAADLPQMRDINRAPSTWKPAARAEFDKLSPAIKAEIHRREADFQNGQSQLLPDAKFGADVRKVVEPYRMLIETAGGSPERAIGDMLRQAATMRTGSDQQKYQTIAAIANYYGIDLRRFGAQGQPQPQAQTFQDPRVDQLLAREREQLQARAQEEQRSTENAVTRWMNEKDAQGNPKRPYLDDVFSEMSALVPQIRQADPTLTHAQALDAAYERATWAHPEVRALLSQQQQTELEQQRRTENQKRVSDAKRAGSVNVPRRASTPSPGKPGKLEDTIAETARALGMIT